jgi:hypothetical protein
MLSGEMAHRIWAYWGRNISESRGKRRKIINKVAQAYEAGESVSYTSYDSSWWIELATTSNNLAEYSTLFQTHIYKLTCADKNLGLIDKILRILSMVKGVDALTSGDLRTDHGDREEVKILLDIGQRIGASGGGA